MSNNLLITYELLTPHANDAGVIAKVKELGGWAKIAASSWYVDSAFTSRQACDHIKESLNAGDKVYVVDSSNGHATWWGLTTEVSTYIKEHWGK